MTKKQVTQLKINSVKQKWNKDLLIEQLKELLNCKGVKNGKDSS